jgi:hypothetical protein
MHTQDIDKFMELVEKRVSKFGWTSIYVPPLNDFPAYAYTVGFSEVGKKDLIIVGEDHTVVCCMFYRLWELTDQELIKGPGTLRKIIQEMDVDLIEMEEAQARRFALVAAERLGDQKLDMLQVIMPDPSDETSSGMTCAEEMELSGFVHKALMH